ncbi:MAG: PKD domain-containing protein [Halobacteriota archaeon]
MKSLQLLSIVLVTVIALTVVSGAGMITAQASETDPTSAELAQAMGCAGLTQNLGWGWSYATSGSASLRASGYVFIMINGNPYDPGEASITVSQVKDIQLSWGWLPSFYGGTGSLECYVKDPNGVVVARQAYGGSSTTPSITVPDDGRLYTVTWALTFQGSDSSSYAFASIGGLQATNRPPVANAGADLATAPNTPISLNGAASYDREGDPITYSWSITSAPAGSTPQLSDPTAARPVFSANVVGDYTLQLVVTDNHNAASTPDTMHVTVDNPPVITIATAQQHGVGSPLFLQGYANDPDNDPLTYQWSLTDKPPESTMQLGLLSTTSIGGFVPDMLGTYTARLSVSDGKLTVTKDVSVLVARTGAPVASEVTQLASAVRALPDSALTPGKKTALLADLNTVQKQVDRGQYGPAAKILKNAVLPRMDGCVKRGTPDSNDFVRTCDQQLQLYPQTQSLALYLAWLQAHPS